MSDITTEPLLELLFAALMLAFGALLPSERDPLPASQAIEYLPQNCELLGYVDLRDANQAIDRLLNNIGEQPRLIEAPGVGELVELLPSLAQQARAVSSSWLGLDTSDELVSLAFCLDFEPQADQSFAPRFLLVLRGSFSSRPATNLARMLNLSPQPLDHGRTLFIRSDGEDPALLEPTPDVLLVGNRALLAPHTAALPPPAPTLEPGSMLERMQSLVQSHGSHMVIAWQPSEATLTLIGTALPTTLVDLMSGMQRMVWTNHGRASSFEIRATNQSTYRDFEFLLRGLAGYPRGFKQMVRTVVYLMAGFIRLDTERPAELRALLSNRGELVAFIDEFVLGPDPEMTFQADPSALSVRLTISGWVRGVRGQVVD